MKIYLGYILILVMLVPVLCCDASGATFKYGISARAILHILPSVSRGLIESINGEVMVNKRGGDSYIPAVKGGYVDFDDVLQLKPNASIEILFEDSSSVVIGPVRAMKWLTLKPL